MFTISKLKSSTRAAAFVEYVALLGLVGVITITAVVEFGGEAAAAFDGAEAVLATHAAGSVGTEAYTMPQATQGLEPIEALALTPYAPVTSSRDPGRFYEEFVVVRVLGGGGRYWHTWAFAEDYNPGEVVTSAPSGFIAEPISSASHPSALCAEASMNLGTVMDPNETFFPGVSPSLTDEAQIQVEEFVVLDRTSDETGLNITEGYNTVDTVASASYTSWSGPGESVQAVYAFTCSRPL